jgi:transcription antitermination factor NusG
LGSTFRLLLLGRASRLTWRAVYCVGRQELAVRDRLREHKFDVFCPKRVVDHRRLVRRNNWVTEKREIAAFPGYLFVFSHDISILRLITGVIDVVRCGVNAIAVPDRLIAHWRATSGEDGQMTREQVSSWFPRKVGDEFVFKAGSPWAGFVGSISSLDRLEERNEIKALVSLFGRMSEVTLDVSYVGRAISGSQITAVAA